MSGGQAFFPQEVSELSAQYDRIIDNLGHRYIIGYTSTNSTRDGKWRKVEIKTRTAGVVDPQPAGILCAREVGLAARRGVMTEDDKREADPKPDLLEMWAGESQVEADAPSGVSRRRLLFELLLAAVLAVVLAKYAVDILFVLLVMAIAALVLHIIEKRLVASGVFTLGGIAIIICGGAFLGYLFFAPSTVYEVMADHVPGPVFAFFDWSESHGWGQTALVHGPDSGGTRSRPAPAASSEPAAGTRSVAPAATSPSLALSASPSSSTLGAPVYLTARLSGDPDAIGPSPAIRFRDGSTAIGVVDVRQEGRTWLATFTTSSLGEGRHELTAELVGIAGPCFGEVGTGGARGTAGR